MYEKLEHSDDLYDHELLEILLYNVCPRVNTNPISHALLERFVTLSNIFEAKIEELKEVKGVGENVARYLKSVGAVAERAGSIGNAPSLKTLSDCKRFIGVRFKDRTSECIELYFLNSGYKVERIFTYTTSEKSRAGVSMDIIARSVALARPHGIIIAHNHLAGTENPSDRDDDFTHAIQFLCNMNEVMLLDHIIYYRNEQFFSYRDNGRLDRTKNSYNWDSFEKWIKTLS